MTADEIDHAAQAVLDLITIGADFYSPIAVAAPILSSFVRAEAARLKTDLAAGKIKPDGLGGFVQHGRSIIDPVTGQFTGEKT